MDNKFLKITYHAGGPVKMNAYLKMPSQIYHVLKKEIEMCLFDERKQPRCEIRTFWIDEDHDEIEIINQCDYDIFLAKRSERQHLQVAPIGVATEKEAAAKTSTSNQQGAAASKASTSTQASTDQTKIPPAAGSYEFAVHEHVECDACLMAPIMGFRYKCIQCPNYDLCQNCEAKHLHSEHMMVRMPNNNCPNVVEAYVTGRTSSSRKHGKRSKSDRTCPFVVKNGLSVVIDDEAENGGGESGEQSSAAAGKERHRGRRHGHRRHHGSNFLSHLYEMMHDLAEGGGAAAAAAATGAGEATTSSTTTNAGPNTSSTTTTTTGPNTSTSTTTSANAFTGFGNIDHNIAATAAAAAANFAAQQAHETAVKSAEIAAKVAHETALQAAKNITANMAAAASTSAANGGSTSASAPNAEQGNDFAKEKVDATTSPHSFQEPQPNNVPNSVPILPSPSLETLAQFLDPQYMKTGIQILNNFSDMFAKMLDPMDGAEGGEASCPFASNLRSATSSTKSSSVASNLNSMGSDKKSEKMSEKSIDTPIENNEQQTKQAESDVSSQVEIDDLGSDSENDSVSESFIKLDAPKETNTNGNITTPPPSASSSAASSTAALNSVHSTPPQSLNKSNVMDFAQLSADLKAHIAEEAEKNLVATPVEVAKVASQQLVAEEVAAAAATNETPKITSTAVIIEPIVTTTTSSSSTSTNTTTTATAPAEPKQPEEKRAVPVYHTDQRINNSVHAMMAMGFSNEGAWLTQLLESVNGNIAEALDLMSVAQRSGQ